MWNCSASIPLSILTECALLRGTDDLPQCRQRVPVLLLTLIVWCVWAGSIRSQSRPFRIVAYYPDYRITMVDTTVGRYVSDLIYFNLRVDSTGGLDRTNISPAGIRKVRLMKERYGLRLQICIGGWWTTTGRHFATVVTDPDLRATLVDNLLAFCLENGFDGVDYDWEYPQNQAEMDGYADLFEATRQVFEPHGMIVSAAVSGTLFYPQRAYEALDKIHIMTYRSFAGDVEKVQGYMDKPIPGEKIFMGTPFYGRDDKQAYSFDTIVQLYHPGPEFNRIAGISFQGIYAQEQRTRFAWRQGLGGMMIWELGHDTHDDHTLLKAIYHAAEQMKQVPPPVSMSLVPTANPGELQLTFAPVAQAAAYRIRFGLQPTAFTDSVDIAENERLFTGL